MADEQGLNYRHFLLCTLAGLLSVIATEYNFGLGNQIDHIPLILDQMEENYLPRDFWVNSNQTIGPRYYYCKLIAAMSTCIQLHITFALLTWFSKSFLALVTCYAVRHFFPKAWTTHIFAISLVLFLGSFNLGDAAAIAEYDLVPALLARPFALLGFMMCLKRHWILATVLGIISTAIHPLVGVETIGIGCIVQTLVAVTSLLRRDQPIRIIITQLIGLLFCGTTILTTLYLLFIQFQDPSPIPTDEFLGLLYCRAPHHYLPSSFPLQDYASFFAFLGACVVAWITLRKSEEQDFFRIHGPVAFLIIILLLFLSCLAEQLSIRIIVVAQFFRMLYLAKWIGYLFLARLAAKAINQPERHYSGWFLLMGTGPLGAFCTLSASLFICAENRIRSLAGRRYSAIAFGVAMLQTSLFIDGNWNETMGLTLTCCIGFLTFYHPYRRLIVTLCSTFPVIALLLVSVSGISVPRITNLTIGIQEIKDPLKEFADFASSNTAKESLFIIPPHINSNFRVIAKRGVLAQTKTVPFTDSALRSWATRIKDVFSLGETDAFPKIQEMNDDLYRQLTEEQLRYLIKTYNCNYAIVDITTETSFKVLLQQGSWKLIDLTLTKH